MQSPSKGESSFPATFNFVEEHKGINNINLKFYKTF